MEQNFFLSLPSILPSFFLSFSRVSCIPGWVSVIFVTKSDLQFLILLLLPFKYERQALSWANFLTLLSSSSVSAECLKFKVCTMGSSYKASCCRFLTLGIETNAGPRCCVIVYQELNMDSRLWRNIKFENFILGGVWQIRVFSKLHESWPRRTSESFLESDLKKTESSWVVFYFTSRS